VAWSHERRNELAREKGFRNYSEYRKVVSYANKPLKHSRSSQGVRSTRNEFQQTVGNAGGRKNANLDEARLYYQAFKETPENDYRIRTKNGEPVVKYENGRPVGAKAKWLIDVMGYVDDAAEWKSRYPTGKRD
jgi:hypothetical protein